jgi:hypothetical protein
MLCEQTFSNLNSLTSVIFAPESNLKQIQRGAFASCRSLTLISLPASIENIDSRAFLKSSIVTIRVEAANRHYFVSGDFLIAFDGMVLIWCFRYTHHVVITRVCQSLGEFSFTNCSWLKTLEFESGSGLTRIGTSACSCSPKVQSVSIPACVETLGDSCFEHCPKLSQFVFETGSRLTEIGSHAFDRCFSLTSICIPTRVESIPKHCFHSAKVLAELLFERGSKSNRLFNTALSYCRSLSVISLPASLEVLNLGLFADCWSLSRLIFNNPSGLRQLDVPFRDFGWVEIPDSVEIVNGEIESLANKRLVLQFGRQSLVMETPLNQRLRRSNTACRPQTVNTIFVLVPECVLRKFRCQFESNW